MTSRKPWMKWYPSDWRADPALRMCSLAARGAWVDMIGLMHEATPYGHLLVKGKPVNCRQLASLIGATHQAVQTALDELGAAGVFSRASDGTIVSRRMIRDARKAAKDVENGRTGGNPNLLKKPTHGLTPPLKPRGQRLEEDPWREEGSLKGVGGRAGGGEGQVGDEPLGGGVVMLRRDGEDGPLVRLRRRGEG